MTMSIVTLVVATTSAVGAEPVAGQQKASPAPVTADSPLPHTALGDQPLRTGSAAVRNQSATVPGVPKAPSMDYQRVVIALIAVIVLIFVLRGLGRFFFPSATSRGQSRVVEVLSRSPLAPKQQVMLLRVGRRVIVVGDSGTQMNTLCEISDPDEVAGLVGQLREEKTAAAAAFSSLFGRFNRRFGVDEQRIESDAASELRDEPEETAASSPQGELDGLRERVRMLAEQFAK
jgi:flagellar biogenesis protein FliO